MKDGGVSRRISGVGGWLSIPRGDPPERADIRTIRDARRVTVAKASGRTLDLGGIEANLGLYPTEVTTLVALEPNHWSRSRSDRAGRRPVEFIENMDRLSEQAGPFDSIVSVLGISRADDPELLVGEIERLLAPDGRLLFAETDGRLLRDRRTVTMVIGSGTLFVADRSRLGQPKKGIVTGTARPRATA